MRFRSSRYGVDGELGATPATAGPAPVAIRLATGSARTSTPRLELLSLDGAEC
jgi:hypothetical protein